ncbi:MAG: DUF4349 domain-containing protein [Candidatus Aenigmarchaeota archaeon]|nr:DUF4349 domain-containing protein [Candidatus Aenigmarchaeota archaeon]
MDQKEIVSFIRENKALSLIGLVFFVVMLFVVSFIVSNIGLMNSVGVSDSMGSRSQSENLYMESASVKSGGLNFESVWDESSVSDSGSSYVEVKEGSMTIDTDNAEDDASEIRLSVESFGGYIEDLRKYDSSYNLNINMRARIPEASFQDFVDVLKRNYDEDDFSVSFYRLSTQREHDELDVLNAAFANYEALRNRTMLIDLDEKQINLLFKIIEKELEIKRLEKQYTSSLAGKQERSDYSTLTIALQQKKEISIMPENLGNQLRLKVKNALSDIVNSLMDIATGSIVVFVSAIKAVIYFILVVIPLIAGFRVLKRIYAKMSKL